MSEADFLQLILLAGIAAGLVLLGIGKIAVAGRGVSVRLFATAGCVLAPGAVLASLGYLSEAAVVMGVVAGVSLVLAVVTSSKATAWLFAALGRVSRPGAQAGLLSAVGGALLIGGLARYESQEAAAIDDELASIAQVAWKPPLRPTTVVAAKTDSGRQVTLMEPEAIRSPGEIKTAERQMLDKLGFTLRAIQISPAAEVSNCHGWVFTGGRYWLSPEEVEHILADNGYQAVSKPRPGDLAIYRDVNSIIHTAVVHSIGSSASAITVEGKWGWMGVYLTPADGSCYGRHVTYYHSARDGHLLVGMGGNPVTPRGSIGDHLAVEFPH